MKRLAILVAAEEAVAAYHNLLEHPGPEAELHLQGCIAFLSLRLAVFQRHAFTADEPIPLPYLVRVPSWSDAAPRNSAIAPSAPTAISYERG